MLAVMGDGVTTADAVEVELVVVATGEVIVAVGAGVTISPDSWLSATTV